MSEMDVPFDAQQPEPIGQERPPLTPPNWAAHSVAEDGGITHETVSKRMPTVKRAASQGWCLVPTEVSLSVADLQIDGEWIRARPTIQVEAGSYSLVGARQLHTALGEFLDAVAADET